VKPYFLPVQSAKKMRQSLTFFGEKATQPQVRAGFAQQNAALPYKKASRNF
jgi:hypothetical protein